MLRHFNRGSFRISSTLLSSTSSQTGFTSFSDGGPACKNSNLNNKTAKMIREKTPIGKLEELDEGKHPYQEKEPLKSFPNGINPETGEIGGPRGPEPTRFGDWERKGRVTDF